MAPEFFYLVVLVAAAAHAGWNAFVKGSQDQLSTLTSLRLVGLPLAIGLLLVFPFPPAAAWPYLLGQVCFIYPYYYFLLNSYRLGDFSAVYPVARGLVPVLVLGVSAWIELDVLSMSDLGGDFVDCRGCGVVCHPESRYWLCCAYGLNDYWLYHDGGAGRARF